MSEELSPREVLFVEAYLVDPNGKQAAIKAGYAVRSAEVQAARLIRKARVRDAIRAAQLARSQATKITSEDVLKRWWMIATADPNDLIEYRRGCCRHCYGVMHRYQETQNERAERYAQWERDAAAAKGTDNEAKFVRFDELGGIGWDPRRAPVEKCIECFGEGRERVFPKDTRLLSPAARALYAGVKVTKDGLDIKMNSQEAALANVAKHLGMFVEKHEHSGPGGGPIETADAVDQLAKLSPAERQALRALATKLDGSEA